VQPGGRVHVVPPAGAQVVDGRDFVTVLHQTIHDVGADEAGASSNHDSHGLVSFPEAGEDRYCERTNSRKRRTVRWAISDPAW
jgi:hypothetical protein